MEVSLYYRITVYDAHALVDVSSACACTCVGRRKGDRSKKEGVRRQPRVCDLKQHMPCSSHYFYVGPGYQD